MEHYIDTSDGLREFCGHLAGSEWVTLDTEFMREKTYFAKLCLIQIANTDVSACIDPLVIDDLQPLYDILFDPKVTKVLHAAHQDLEIFHHLTGKVPAPVFDTQIAASLAGHGDQIGYGGLVGRLLQVQLDKTHTRTDWSMRPLSEAQIRYALDDVIYLRDIYLQLQKTLEERGRLQWLDEDFRDMTNPATYAPATDDAWRKIRGSQKLKGRQLVALRDLVTWRDARARKADKPRKWILRDEVMLELARQLPKRDDMRRVRGVEEHVIKRQGKALSDMIEHARQAPEAEWPTQQEATTRLDANQDALVDALMAIIRLCAAEQDVSAATLATRRDIERLVRGDENIPLMHGWRAALAGDAARNFLHGEQTLSVTGARLELN